MKNESIIRKDPSPVKEFAIIPTFPRKVKKAAYLWQRELNYFYKEVVSSEETIFFVHSHGFPQVTCLSDVSRFTTVYSSFKDFQDNCYSIYKVSINISNWPLSNCSCVHWLKNYCCKHVFACSNILNLVQYSSTDKSLPISSKKQRGRPPKAPKATNPRPRNFAGFDTTIILD